MLPAHVAATCDYRVTLPRFSLMVSLIVMPAGHSSHRPHSSARLTCSPCCPFQTKSAAPVEGKGALPLLTRKPLPHGSPHATRKARNEGSTFTLATEAVGRVPEVRVSSRTGHGQHGS